MKKRTRKLLSVLLAAAMLLSLMPVGAQAATSMEKELHLNIVKSVVQGGSVAPPSEVFEFELVDNQNPAKDLADYGVRFDKLEIKTFGGEEDYGREFIGQLDLSMVNEKNGWKVTGPKANRTYQKTFTLREKNTGADNWNYAENEYSYTIKYNRDTVSTSLEKLDIAVNNVEVLTFPACEPQKANFTNTYIANDIGFSFFIAKSVVQESTVAPPAKTFEFELADMQTPAKEVADYGILIDDLKIATNGAGYYTEDFSGKLDLDLVNTNNGWNIVDGGDLEKSFILREKSTEEANWIYSDEEVVLTIVYDTENQYAYAQPSSIAKEAMNVAEFTNRYNKNGLTFTIDKIVEQGGNVAPSKETFTFELVDPQQPDKTPADFGVILDKLTIDTNGVGEFTKDFAIKLDPDKVHEKNGWAEGSSEDEQQYIVQKSFNLREKDGKVSNWTYADNEYMLTIKYFPRTNTGNISISIGEVEEVDMAEFANTYTRNSSGGGGGGGIAHFTLTYESNGGTEYAKETYSPGKKVELDKTPTREGYDFTGWYSDKGTTDKITSVTMNSSKTVYAGWKFTGALNSDDHVAYVHGYPDGTVGPNRNVTRAETASMLYRLLTEERSAEITTNTNSFSDVSRSLWYNKAVSSMANGNYITGYVDGTFGGDKSITRAEFVTMMVRFINPAEGTKTFTDVPSTHWAYKSISTATAAGWISGYTDGSFGPEERITRAEALTIINRVLNRGVDSDSELLSFKKWPDNKSGDWFYYDVIEASNDHEYIGARPSEDWTKLL